MFSVFLDSSSEFGMEATPGPLCWEDTGDTLNKDLEAATAKGDRPPQS